MTNFRMSEFAQSINHLVSLARGAGTYNGTGIDTRGFNAIQFDVAVGDIAAGGTIDVKIQESDDNSAFSDIAGAAIVQLIATDDNKIPTIDVKLGGTSVRKRYVRAQAVVAAATSSFAVVAHLYMPHEAPVSQSVVPKIV